MRIRYQAVERNKRETQKAVLAAKRKRNEVSDSIHQASTIAGEFIAARNRGRSSSNLLSDITRHYKPEYLESRDEGR